MDKFDRFNIPVIAVDIPCVDATYFGMDHYRIGDIAGVTLGRWLNENWDNTFDRLTILEGKRTDALPATRIQSQLDGLQEVIGEIPSSHFLYLDSDNATETHHPESRLVDSTDYWPERYGEKLIQIATKILNGESVPLTDYNKYGCITYDKIDKFYPESRITEGV
jgi:hypothetical protein